MTDLKTKREFQERFLDGFDRSKLRQEVQKVKPARSSLLSRKYASLVLGATLAIGGLGIPLTASHMLDHKVGTGPDKRPSPANAENQEKQLTQDLQTAASIAQQVTGGVRAAASTVTGGVQVAAETASISVEAVAHTAGVAETAISNVAGTALSHADSVKEAFFKREVPFGSIIFSEARKNNLSPELVAAVVQAESKFNAGARSGAGAIGLMQLVPKTGRWMGARDLTNPAQNVAAGAKYLRYLNDRFDGDQQKMIAAYNAGEGSVRRFNGVPPYRETQNYVSRVNGYQHDLGDRVASMTIADASAMSAR